LKVLVLIKEVYDTKVPLEYDVTGGVKTDWNVSMLNPEDGSAIEAALKLKESIPETRITVVHLGPVSEERYIRESIALGCDDGIRIWDGGLRDLHTRGKASILARAAQTLTYDLILTGTQSEDLGNAQLGILLASALEIPCVTRVTTFEKTDDGAIDAVRKLSEGYRERVKALLPVVITMEANEESYQCAALPPLFESMERRIPCFDLSDLGISAYEIREKESLLLYGPLRFPSCRLKHLPAPDSSLPAYERREMLLQGSMLRREGKIVKGDEDSMVEEIFQTLLKHGWLNHLRKED